MATALLAQFLSRRFLISLIIISAFGDYIVRYFFPTGAWEKAQVSCDLTYVFIDRRRIKRHNRPLLLLCVGQHVENVKMKI